MRGRSNGKITNLLEDKPYMDRILNTPVNRLTTEELFLAELHFMLEDAKKGDKELLTFRDSINFCWNWRWSELQTILKKHREELDKLFRRYGYIRVSKTGWRKFRLEDLKHLEQPLESLAKFLQVDIDSAYVVYCAYRLLKLTVPTLKDWQGYNIVHAWAFYKRLSKSKITMEDINWMNIRLLNYEEQIKELGLDYEKLRQRAENIIGKIQAKPLGYNGEG
jgi:hypothetical protein